LKSVLSNRNIVITRSEEQSSGLIDMLSSAGANIISIPTIKIVPVDDYSEFDRLISDSSKFDFIIFTSANSVKYFIRRIDELDVSVNIDEIIFVAVGESTLNICKQYNIPVDIIPEDFRVKGLLEKFNSWKMKNKKVLIPCSAIARTELKEGLIKLGACVLTTPVYDVALPDENEATLYREKLKNINPDLYVFTSPSTYNNFLKIFEIDNPVNYFSGAMVAAIGPTTADTVESTGVVAGIIPESFTVNNLFQKIVEHFSTKD
jgi:uroporphyrinogen-III synthase